MTHENKDISELVPHENNPRRISKDQYARLEKTLEEFGDLSGVVFNSQNGKLVGGHMRTKVFKSLKSDIVITEKRKDPDEQGTIAWGFIKDGEKRYSYREVVWDEPKHEKAMLIANKAGGEFDFDMLANHWDVDFLVDEIGFESAEFGLEQPEELEPTDGDDDVPESAPAITVKGDLYELGNHRVLCGDATMVDEVEKLMSGENFIALIDPPYGVDIVTDGKVGADFGVAKKGGYSPIINDDTTETAKNAVLTLRSLGVDKMVIWGGNYFTDFLEPSKSWIVWDKRCDTGIRNTFADAELAWTNCGSPVRIFRQLWNGMIREGEKDKRVHPTQKPLDLLCKIIQEYLGKEDKILDTFLGSGSTLIASEKAEKVCYGMELDEKYCDVIVKRYINFCRKNNKTCSVKRNGEDCLSDFED